MKYIITENRLIGLVEKLFDERYGTPLNMSEDDDYLYFRVPGLDPENRPFDRNAWGMLWVNDYIIYKRIKSLLGLNNEETKDLIKNFFENKYSIKIKKLALEHPSFEMPGDNLEMEIDPFFDDIDDE